MAVLSSGNRRAQVLQNDQLNNNGNTNKQYAHKVSAIAGDNHAVVDEDTEEGAVGYTSNNINRVPRCGVNKSPFHDALKLAGVPGQINNYHNPRILVDSGSLVTIIRSDLWKQIKDPKTIVNEEEECFQGVTHDVLKIVGITQLTLPLGKLHVKHPVLIVDKIAQKFILGNNFLTQYKCDLLNSAKAIVFGGEQVPNTLFRSTVNSICPVICSTTTTIGPYEEIILPALLDANAHYATNQTLLLEPTTLKSSPILKARVDVKYTSVVVPLLIANISSAPVTIKKGEMLAVDKPLKQHSFSEEPAEHHCNKKTHVQEACDRADPLHTREQKSALFALLNEHSEAFSANAEDLGRTNLIYHTIDIGYVVLCVRALGAFLTSKSECSKKRWTNCKALVWWSPRVHLSRAQLFWSKRRTEAGVSASTTVSSTR